MKQPVTLTEVARTCGVHPSTVSRALATEPKGISAATVARVREAAAALGYVPDQAAAALKTGRSHTIGVIVPRLTDYVLARIYEGCEDAAAVHGFTTMVLSSTDDTALRLERFAKFVERRVDGLIVADSRITGDTLLRRVTDSGIPFVLTNRAAEAYTSVTADEHLGGRLVADHLYSLGHRRIGVIGGWDYATSCLDRVAGFTTRMAELGVEIPAEAVVHGVLQASGGHQVAGELLTRFPEITAVFAVNDFAAIGAMGAATAAGRRPGVDFAVVGYNDIPLCTTLPVPLTSVDTHMYEIGRQTAEVLIAEINGEAVTSRKLVPALRVRESSAAL